MAKVNVHPRTGHKGPEGSRCIASVFLQPYIRWDGWLTPHSGRFTSRKKRYTLYGRLGWRWGRPGRVRKIFPSTGIRSMDRPTHSKYLYRLHYRDSQLAKSTAISSVSISKRSCEFHV